MQKNRVMITGLGVVSGPGLTTDSFWDALKSGRSAINDFSLPNAETKIARASILNGYQPEDYFTADELTTLDLFSQYAVIAASQAITDAGMEKGDKHLKNAAAIIGSGCGGKHTDEDTYQQLYKNQRTRAHPLTIPKGMPSAAASMVCSHSGIKGPSFMISSACASGSHAIIQGMAMIQAGLVEVALVGATDAPFTYGLLKSWEALRVASNDTCRPFCKDRSGLVLGEGAAMLVLESESHAKARNARIYAELAGSGMSSDAGHITRPDIDGICKAISTALIQAGLQPEDVDYINAHGTATMANDSTETEAIRRVFKQHADKLAVSSTKSIHGHALGASSALEVAASVLAIYHGILPPTVNFTEAAEDCTLDYVPNTARKKDINVALSNSFAFGGLNAVIALKKYN